VPLPAARRPIPRAFRTSAICRSDVAQGATSLLIKRARKSSRQRLFIALRFKRIRFVEIECVRGLDGRVKTPPRNVPARGSQLDPLRPVTLLENGGVGRRRNRDHSAPDAVDGGSSEDQQRRPGVSLASRFLLMPQVPINQNRKE